MRAHVGDGLDADARRLDDSMARMRTADAKSSLKRVRRDQVNAAASRLSCRKPTEKREYSPQFGSHPGESQFNLRAIAANISELLRSLDKPPLAELPFFVGC